MPSEILKLVITGDSAGAVRALKGVDAQANKTLTNTTTSTKGLGKALGSISTAELAAGFAVLGTAALKFGADATRAAQEDQAAHAVLRQAVENTGASYDAYGTKIQGVEKKLINLGFADDETAASLARLTGATGDVGKAVDQMGLAADIARGRNISLGQATEILTKVEIGNVGALRRLGIQTKDATGATISQEEALKRLTKLYGGQASAFTDTYAGKVQRLTAQLGELQEQIGYYIIPALSAVADGASSLIGGFDKANAATQDWAFGFDEFGKAALKSVPIFGSVVSGIDLLGATQDDNNATNSKAIEIQEELAKAKAAYAEDIANETTATAEGKKHREALTEAQQAATAVSTGLSAATDDATESTKDAGSATEDYGKKMKEAEDRANEFVDGVLGLSAALGDQEAAFIKVGQELDEYNAAKQEGTKTADELRLMELGVEDSLRRAALAASEANKRMQEQAGGSQNASEKIDAQRAALELLRQKFPQLAPVIQAHIRELDRIQRNITTTIQVVARNSGIGGAGQFTRPAGRAVGGPVTAGQPYIVGENGPEAFVPGTSGRIVPNGGGGPGGFGGTTVVVNVHGSVIAERDLVQKVKDGLIAAQRRGYAA
jgi:hypothetical protein